jgi:hypothetical protein
VRLQIINDIKMIDKKGGTVQKKTKRLARDSSPTLGRQDDLLSDLGRSATHQTRTAHTPPHPEACRAHCRRQSTRQRTGPAGQRKVLSKDRQHMLPIFKDAHDIRCECLKIFALEHWGIWGQADEDSR